MDDYQLGQDLATITFIAFPFVLLIGAGWWIWWAIRRSRRPRRTLPDSPYPGLAVPPYPQPPSEPDR